MSKGKQVFVREATGLVREIGWFTALAMVMSAVIGAGINSFAVQAYGWTSAAGINAVSPLAMVLLVAIPFGCSAICLGIMSSAMPRSGGPYVIMSRAVSPSVGFLASWGSWVSIALSVGLLANYDIYFWGTSFKIAGAIYNNGALVNLGLLFQDIWPSIWLGVALTVVITLLAALGANIWGRVVQALFIIPLVGSVFTIAALLIHTAGDLPTYWNAVFGAGSYATIAASAVPYTPDFVLSFAALPGIIFAYSAFYASSYVGGEVKNPKKNMVLSLIGGMGLIILLFVVYTGGLARAVGEEFLYAYNVVGGPAPAQLPLFAAVYTYSIPILSIFISITGALWLLNDLPPFFLIATRSTFAWSFDRQFPEKFAEVSDRFHSPLWSALICGIVAIPGVFFSALTAWGSLVFITFIDCFTYLFICVAGLTFIGKFKSAYDKGTKLEWETTTGNALGVGFLISLLAIAFGIAIAISSASMLFIGIGLTLIGAIGVIFSIAGAASSEDHSKPRKVPALKVFGWIGTFFWVFMLVAMLFYIFTVDPIVAGYYGMVDAPFWESVMILATFAIGLIVYGAFKLRNKRRGIDVGAIYSEIPPE
ncbi:MAG: APC family permease [Promethearchaeati archaeon SRVP18_Atabeyarchaeia-1]